MIATKLSALLLFGLVTAPSIAVAGPNHGPRNSPAAATDRLTTGDRSTSERGAANEKRMDGLCARLECTPEQSDAIRTIRNESRERLKASRQEVRELFTQMKALRNDGESRAEIEALRAAIDTAHRQHDRLVAGAIARIGGVLDDSQRAELMLLVERHGAKVALGGHAKHHGEGKAKLAKFKRAKHERDLKLAKSKRAKHERHLELAKSKRSLAKRDRA